jgi:hypothetical protein
MQPAGQKEAQQLPGKVQLSYTIQEVMGRVQAVLACWVALIVCIFSNCAPCALKAVKS